MSSPYNASVERMSVFGPTLRFKGELKAQEDLKVEGKIEGTIHHQQRVIVGSKGEVVATVTAASIDVEGRVQGDMHAKKSVKVSSTAVVRGNIRAPSVSITEGANFNGSVTMEPSTGSGTQGITTPGAPAESEKTMSKGFSDSKMAPPAPPAAQPAAAVPPACSARRCISRASCTVKRTWNSRASSKARSNTRAACRSVRKAA